MLDIHMQYCSQNLYTHLLVFPLNALYWVVVQLFAAVGVTAGCNPACFIPAVGRRCCFYAVWHFAAVSCHLTLLSVAVSPPDFLSCCWIWRNIILNSTPRTTWRALQKRRGNSDCWHRCFVCRHHASLHCETRFQVVASLYQFLLFLPVIICDNPDHHVGF